MESRLFEIASQLFVSCRAAADAVDCLEAELERLRAEGRWSDSELANVEKQTLRMLYEEAVRKREP